LVSIFNSEEKHIVGLNEGFVVVVNEKLKCGSKNLMTFCLANIITGNELYLSRNHFFGLVFYKNTIFDTL
jgi:hypothetical protein